MTAPENPTIKLTIAAFEDSSKIQFILNLSYNNLNIFLFVFKVGNKFRPNRSYRFLKNIGEAHFTHLHQHLTRNFYVQRQVAISFFGEIRVLKLHVKC